MNKERQQKRRAKMKAFAAAVKKFFTSTLPGWFKKVSDELLPVAMDLALTFMTGFKTVTDSNVIDFITNLTQSTKDDLAAQWVRDATEKVIDGILEGKECLKKETLPEKILCLADYVKTLTKAERRNLLNGMHADLIAGYHENRLSNNHDYMVLAVNQYQMENFDMTA